jgi:hypothetical protein
MSMKPYIMSCYADISKKGLGKGKGITKRSEKYAKLTEKNTPGLQQDKILSIQVIVMIS